MAPYAESQGSLDFLAGMGEDNITEFGAALEGEGPLRGFLEPMLPMFQTIQADQIVDGMSSLLPEVDRAYCTGELGEEMAASFREAVRIGVDGWVDDDLAFVSPWGYDLDAIAVPVSVWQGSADLMVPFAHGQWLAGAAAAGAGCTSSTARATCPSASAWPQQIVDELVEVG